MLNRRTLRIKAMQAIYAYMQAEGSDYLMALDLIEDDFAPDLNSMEVQNKQLLEGKKQIGTLLFKEWYKTRQFDTEETDKEILQSVNSAVNFYQKQVKNDYKFFSNQMLSAVENIYDHYLAILALGGEIAKQIDNEEVKKATRFTEKKDIDLQRLTENKVFQQLLANKSLQQLIIRRSISWEKDADLITQFYRTVLKQDETIQAYVLKSEEHTFEEDKELAKYFFKTLIFKDKNLQAWFEEHDLNWQENKAIVKSLVMKTIKSIEETTDENLALLDLSTNWEDDKAFFEELYHKTLEDDAKYEAMIAAGVKNWDIERVAVIDKIILKMALCEMHIFRSIPVKVTINEYIEISKLYSTPKSKQFINGVLDKLAQDLTDSGSIRKSGRGLIDNK
ncbi:transcription antitermination factor NusB [Adhaeribacter sp. BT258]|uniref:Transcription antitermination protein NusB n=1 Tax=Adhaeribacter terrigena TaxID=2793070 RepID=A0ABS1C4H6_9BACT|nr:transcription antitermination factor NusB [Adhaeribacter terrigena]MBK0403430.1 transcription antitermination factor NusB [Adhaeribacter terrigena]